MIQRLVVVLLIMVVVFVGCDEKESDKVKPKEVVDEGPKKRIIWEKDGAKMVLIEGFARTKDTYDDFGDLVPGKLVKVSDPFYMDTTEVTVGQFKKFVKETGYKYDRWDDMVEYSPTDKHPIILVSWFDATAYCEWTGKRLPTEKEWEFAARGGLKNKEFPWGDEESIAREYANFYGVLGRDQWDKTTAPVGSFRPNGYGLHDMAGNVWEWCQNWYNRIKYPGEKAIRGGGRHLLPESLHVGCRASGIMSFRSYVTGFRCVLRVPKLDPSAQFEGNFTTTDSSVR